MNKLPYIAGFCLLVLLYSKRVQIYGMYARYDNAPQHRAFLHVPHIVISQAHIPTVLHDRMAIMKSGLTNFSNKGLVISSVMDACKTHAETIPKEFFTDDICVLDYLDLSFSGGYAFSAHTDTEWNAISNEGYQAWVLVHNNNKQKIGNIVFIYNEYIDTKYRGSGYTLLVRDPFLVINKNCGIFSKNVLLEKVDLQWFFKNTTVFYLDIDEGDCCVFDRSLCHMSDVRGSAERHAINFRVIKGDPNFTKGCGYVKNPRCAYRNNT